MCRVQYANNNNNPRPAPVLTQYVTEAPDSFRLGNEKTL